MLDTIMSVLGEIVAYNNLLLFVILFAFVFIGFKLLKHVFRALMIGALAASFPIIAPYLGFEVAINLHNILWFGLFGVIGYFAYTSISTGLKIVKLALRPFTNRPKQKEIVVHERIKEVPLLQKKKK